MFFFFPHNILSVEEMNEIENWITEECIPAIGKDKTGDEIAHELNLKVEYVPSNELPKHVEAILCPADKPGDSDYYGVIRVNKEKGKKSFAYIHEIMHYLRDVGRGKPVTETYTRKERGHTDEPHEQSINYATAAYCLPRKEILEYINEYDEQGIKANAINLVKKIGDKYEQSDDAVLRRIREVRRLDGLER